MHLRLSLTAIIYHGLGKAHIYAYIYTLAA